MGANGQTCGDCEYCRRLVTHDDANAAPTVVWYCRRRPPVASASVIAKSGTIAVTRGIWPSVDPDMDGCAEFEMSDVA